MRPQKRFTRAAPRHVSTGGGNKSVSHFRVWRYAGLGVEVETWSSLQKDTLEARPELQDWLRFELFTVKNYRTGPFLKKILHNFELYSSETWQSQNPFLLGPEHAPLTVTLLRLQLWEGQSSPSAQASEDHLAAANTARFKISSYIHTHWGQKDYLPNLYCRRIILGNSMCFMRTKENLEGD